MKSISLLKIVLMFALHFFAVSRETLAAEHLNMQITNCIATSNEIQFDFLLLNDGTEAIKMNSSAFRINHNAAMIPAGTNTYSLTYIGGSDFPAAFLAIPTTYNLNYNPSTGLMSLTMSPGNYNSSTAISIPVGGPPKKVGRFSLKITNTNWVSGVPVNLAYAPSGNGAVVYINSSTITSVMNQTTPSIFTASPPCSMTIPTACSISSSVTANTPVTCYGGNDGTASISLTNAVAPVSWTVNGVAASGNGVTNSFSSLHGGTNSVSATDFTGCVHVLNFVIGGPSDSLRISNCSHTQPTCPGGMGMVTAGALLNTVGTVSYAWKDHLGNTVGASASATVPAGTYTLTVTDNCFSATCTQVVADPDTLISDYSSTSCDSYSLPWGGSATTSGDYHHTYTSSAGCDSFVTAHVTILTSSSSSFADTANDLYVLPWGDTVTASGNYDYAYVSANGCDSIVTADIHIISTVGISDHDVSRNFYFIKGSSVVFSDDVSKAGVYNLSGQRMDERRLAKGVYIVRFTHKDKSFRQKIGIFQE